MGGRLGAASEGMQEMGRGGRERHGKMEQRWTGWCGGCE